MIKSITVLSLFLASSAFATFPCSETAKQAALQIERLLIPSLDKEDVYPVIPHPNGLGYIVLMSNLDKGLAGVSYSVHFADLKSCRVVLVKHNWTE